MMFCKIIGATNMTDNKPQKSRKKWAFLVVMALLIGLGWQFFTQKTNTASQPAKPKQIAVNSDPVVYPFDEWQPSSKAHFDATTLQNTLGKTHASEQTLDYQGNMATLSWHSTQTQAVFYSVDSPMFFEVVWHYPQAIDNQSFKTDGINHARQTHQMMSVIAGKTGAKLVEQMLQGQTLNAVKLSPWTLVSGACQQYRCRLILQKTA